MKTADLVIIGGGPAGSAAAIIAARSGARVILLEAGHFPKHKVCGEFVSAESLDLLGNLLDGSHQSLLTNAVRISHARLFADERLVRTVVEPAAASIPRFNLDAALWESAERAATEVLQQVRAQEIRGHGPFVVRTSTGEIEARSVIDASGRWSNIRPAPAAADTGSKWIGLKAHFAEDSPPVSVDLYFFSGGYCGVQPVDGGQVNACAMVRADVATTLFEVFELHPALQERSRDWQIVSEPVSVAPLFFGTPQPVCGQVLKAGDAAGFVDPFVGDGISLALRSGALAGECLLAFVGGTISLEDAARRYATNYEEKFASVFRSSARLRRALQLPKTVRKPILSILQRSPAITGYLVKKTR
jgi:menaquinone-9 beta-reductase